MNEVQRSAITESPDLVKATLIYREIQYEFACVLYPLPGYPPWRMEITRPSSDEPEDTSDYVYFDRCSSPAEAFDLAEVALQQIGHQCPCCGYLTLPERGVATVCTVCCYVDHDDREVYGVDWAQTDWDLFDARVNLVACGAARKKCLGQVREPQPQDRSLDYVEWQTLRRDSEGWDAICTYRDIAYRVDGRLNASSVDTWRVEGYRLDQPDPTRLFLGYGATIDEAIVYTEHFVRVHTKMGKEMF